MMMTDSLPTARRVTAALVMACLASVAIAFADTVWQVPAEARVNLAKLFVFFGVPLALFHASVLALPAYLLLRRRWTLRWWSAALVGFIVGMVPLALLSLDPGYTHYRQGQDVLVEAGRYTSAGWMSYFSGVATSGLYGLSGGLTFWLVLEPRRRRQKKGRPG